jgi:hypothetical protein
MATRQLQDATLIRVGGLSRQQHQLAGALNLERRVLLTGPVTDAVVPLAGLGAANRFAEALATATTPSLSRRHLVERGIARAAGYAPEVVIPMLRDAYARAGGSV